MVTLELLLGSDHSVYGEIATRAIGERTAIGLSIGTHPKGYPSVDPNEDAVLGMSGPTGTLLAVADGHNGFDAARNAVSSVASIGSRLLASTSEDSDLVEITRGAAQTVRDHLDQADAARPTSRTTLLTALIRHRRLSIISHGDSSAFLVRGRSVKILNGESPFLGRDPASEPHPRRRWRLRESDVVILATDGLIDFLGENWKATIRSNVTCQDSPEAMVQGLISAAGSHGAGDNIAVAIAIAS